MSTSLATVTAAIHKRWLEVMREQRSASPEWFAEEFAKAALEAMEPWVAEAFDDGVEAAYSRALAAVDDDGMIDQHVFVKRPMNKYRIYRAI